MKITLVIPDFSDRQAEWATVAEEANPVERDLIKVQSRLTDLLNPLVDSDASPEHLAWTSLWSRTFNSCEGARASFGWGSPFPIQFCTRALFECTLNLGAIFEPFLRNQPADDTDPWGALRHMHQDVRVRQRLCALTAWALYGDLRYWTTLARPEMLRSIYDPTPAREMVSLMGEWRPFWEGLLGKVDEQSGEEAMREREQASNVAARRIAQIEEWLGHPALQVWYRRLRSERPRSLFGLLDSQIDSVRGHLRAMGMEPGYLEYMRSSAALHGSTLESTIDLRGIQARAQLGASQRRLEAELAEATRWAQSNVLFLELLSRHLPTSA